MPATVQTMLAARIDRLSPEEKKLLQSAAVIGREFSLPLLQAIVGPTAAISAAGSRGCRPPSSSTRRSLFPEIEYTFKHVLTQEVAYDSLLQDRRRALHARILEAIEGLAADRLAGEVEHLAHHAFRGEVWDKAVAYLRQAGTKALERSANREAVGCFEQALVALEHLPEDPRHAWSRASTSAWTCARRSCRWPTAAGSSTTCSGPKRSRRRWATSDA